ncbi:MAG TPA: DNA methyltransferase [Longimicrobium sp.]|nr:DNA methyltransferase [Longimicrobium sp.]
MNPTVELHCTDTVPGMLEGMHSLLEPNSIDCIITSIPFGALFMYSGKPEDIGNNPDGADLRADRFALNMRFAVEGMYRVLKPGRVACIHIQQLRATQIQHGYIGRRNFMGAVVDLFTGPRRICACPACLQPVTARYPHCGWCGSPLPFHEPQAPAQPYFEHVGEIAIRKNPQLVAKRETVHSLMFETGRRDACRLAPTCNDYVFFFRKPGENKVPVRALYDPSRPQWNPGGWMSLDEWVCCAHGVWADISETDVLENWRGAREEGDEKHVCPQQLTTIRRCKNLYTNPGETILDPFMGIGSTAVVTVEPRTELRTGRELPGCNAVGFELKESYHAKSLRYVAAALDGRLERNDPRRGDLALFDDSDARGAA